MYKFIVLSLLLAVSLTAEASKYRDPSPAEIFDKIATAPSANLFPQNFNLLVWNVHKALAKAAWAQDFSKLAENSDLVVLQEAMDDDFSDQTYSAIPSFGWWMAVAYIEKSTEIKSGVLIGAKVNPLRHRFFLSNSKEPVSQTGHAILTSYFPMANGETLMVGDVHGINFVLNYKWTQQMSSLQKMIADHQGPAIVAGDFNTWNGGRIRRLDNMLGVLGFKKSAFSTSDPRRMKLDHIYLRNCVAKKQELLTNIKSSDHSPILSAVSCF